MLVYLSCRKDNELNSIWSRKNLTLDWSGLYSVNARCIFRDKCSHHQCKSCPIPQARSSCLPLSGVKSMYVPLGTYISTWQHVKWFVIKSVCISQHPRKSSFLFNIYFHTVDNVCLSTRHRKTNWRNAKWIRKWNKTKIRWCRYWHYLLYVPHVLPVPKSAFFFILVSILFGIFSNWLCCGAY